MLHGSSSSFPAVGALLLMPGLPGVCAGEVIVDHAHGFSLTLPDGFVPDADFASATPNIIYTFVRRDADDEESGIILFVEKLGGTLRRERLKQEHLPPETKARLFTTIWQEFEISAVEVPVNVEGTETLTYNAQIPLKRAAIQIRLLGAADQCTAAYKAIAKKHCWASQQWHPRRVLASRLNAGGELRAFVRCGIAAGQVFGVPFAEHRVDLVGAFDRHERFAHQRRLWVKL
jgi:hypothetical protein